jgi:hypothetical protein
MMWESAEIIGLLVTVLIKRHSFGNLVRAGLPRSRQIILLVQFGDNVKPNEFSPAAHSPEIRQK